MVLFDHLVSTDGTSTYVYEVYYDDGDFEADIPRELIIVQDHPKVGQESVVLKPKWTCQYECGMLGSFVEVATHEQTCSQARVQNSSEVRLILCTLA